MDTVPSEFLCPISMELMTDPVLCADGQTYDRKSIMQWLSSSNTSPITRQPLYSNQIYPNFALKSAMQRWQDEKKRAQAHPPSTPLLSYQMSSPHPFYTKPAKVPAQIKPPVRLQESPILIYESPEAQIQHQTRTVKLVLICCSLIIFFVVISLIISINTRSDD
jgi:hypothetical protein